jgi:hypothetical protein
LNSLSQRNELLLVYLLTAYCAYYLIVSLSTAWEFTTDDAYISWLYARQLALGKGLRWHETMPFVEGYSNFLWVIVSSWIIKLQWPLVITMKWISIFSLAMALIFLYRLSRLFFSPLLAMLPVLLFSHYTGVIWWTVSGLESIFFCALSLLFIWQCVAALGYVAQLEQSNVSTGSWLIANFVLLLLGLTRFEGIIWSVPMIFFIFCQLRTDGLNRFPHGYKTIALWGIITLFCFILPYTAYFIWRVGYFSHWLPNSYLCKASVPGQFAIVDLNYLQIISSLIVASLPYFLSSKDCRHTLLWLPSLLYGLMLWRAEPVITYHLRLFLGPFALFCLLPVLGVYEFLYNLKRFKWDLKLITSFVIISLTFIFIPGNDLSYIRTFVADYQERNQNRITIAKILNDQAAKGATVLLGDCGLIPFNARPDIRFIDSQCLNNIELSQFPDNNLKLYANYIQRQVKPDWVIVSEPFSEVHNYFLMTWLEKNHFLANYRLIDKLQSGAVSNNGSKKNIDYTYLIYERRK